MNELDRYRGSNNLLGLIFGALKSSYDRTFHKREILEEGIQSIEFVPFSKFDEDMSPRDMTAREFIWRTQIGPSHKRSYLARRHSGTRALANILVETEPEKGRVDEVDIQKITAVTNSRTDLRADLDALSREGESYLDLSKPKIDLVNSLRESVWKRLGISNGDYPLVLKCEWNNHYALSNCDASHRFASLRRLARHTADIKMPCRITTVDLDPGAYRTLTEDFTVILVHPETGSKMRSLFDDAGLTEWLHEGDDSDKTMSDKFCVFSNCVYGTSGSARVGEHTAIFLPINNPLYSTVVGGIFPKLSRTNHVNFSSFLLSQRQEGDLVKANTDKIPVSVARMLLKS
jgi:hypothetical protein